jgi:hypothetical protein
MSLRLQLSRLLVARIPWDGAGLGLSGAIKAVRLQSAYRADAGPRVMASLLTLYRDAHARRGNEASGN